MVPSSCPFEKIRLSAAIAITVLAFTSYSCLEEKTPPRPNILFILADDQCYQTIRELGNTEVITPTLDELARQGTVFTTAYNMGGWNGAICVASRTMFQTGRFLWRAHEAEPRLQVLAEEGRLWSKEMERLGYDTYMTGKWHVKIDPSGVFHHVGTVRGGMPDDTPEGYNRPLSADDWEWTPWDTAFGGFWQGGTHWSEVVANETMAFLDSTATSENPFFMYVAFNAPHDPRQSPREYVDMYPLENIAVPESFLAEYPYNEAIGCGPELRDEMLAPFPRTEYAVKVHRQEYYAIITHMDAQIRRILWKLEQTGQAGNTCIFFSADHGLSVGHHGLMGKQNMFDHSLRPPMIVAGPGIPKGEKREMAVYLQDIMPTVIEYAGGEIPPYVDFHSLKPLIEGSRQDSYYPQMYGAYMDLQRMIRKDNFKLIVYTRANVKRLFDLSRDPGEIHDLASEPDQQERVESMFRELQGLQGVMGDTLELL
jgi:arylsulfatase A-like enzyme